MNPQRAAEVLLALCLALVVLAYALGVEAGRTKALLVHPGYEAARSATVSNS